MTSADRPFDPETLIEHRDFVRALARKLLSDEHSAEDVAQEAYIAALEAPPRSGDALRAWLARVTRNLSINKMRESERRERREVQAARSETVAGGIDERLHAQRRVIEAVLALREPYKSAIWMRWYEGLPPREIAKRTKAPVETVKSRLKRGLAELKLALDHEFGDRTEWQRALIPLTWLERATVGTSTLLIGGAALVLAVGTWAVAAIATTVPVTNVSHVADARRPASIANVSPATYDALARSSIVAGDSTPPPALTRTGEEALAPVQLSPADAVAVGVVYELDFDVPAGLAAGDFRCSLELDNPLTPVAERFESPVESDSRSFARFSQLPRTSLVGGGARSTFTLRLSSTNGMWSGIARVVASGRSPVVSVRFDLEPRAVVRGVVTLHDQRPVAGARVRITNEAGAVVGETRTASDGTWILPAVRPGSVRAAVRTREAAEVVHTITLSSLAITDVETVIAPAATTSLTGVLHSRSGLHSPRGPVRLVSVADRSFVLESLPETDVRESLSQVPAGTDIREDRFLFQDVAPGEYEVFPPMGDAFAWTPASLIVTLPCAPLRFACRDDVPTTAVVLRAVAADTGERIESLRATILLDRYDLGRRRALALEPEVLRVEVHNGEAHFPVIPSGMRGWWLVEADGRSSAWGELGDLSRRGGRLETEARLAPAWKAEFWIGTRDANGNVLALSDARIVTRGGALLTTSLADGHALLDLLFDPGRIHIELPGWKLTSIEGFSGGKLRQPRDLHRVWMERDD